MVKRILTILLLLVSVAAYSETYYIKTGGSDAGAGTTDATAWETITKVNTTWAAGTFVPGDSILFNRGDTFYGTITVAESGTSGNPIYIGAYGTGNDPIITGFQTLSSWTDAGGSIYYATLSSASDTTSTLTVDGVLTALGRYPNAGTNLTYESHSTSVSITDTGLGDATDWAGADAVINKNWYILERVHITDHTGDALTYKPYYSSSVSSVNDNRYYFIQNDLRTLDVTNEWWHDYANSRIYIYGNPAAKTVKAAALNYLIELGTARDYITIENIRLEGSIRNAINIGSETGFYGNNDHIIIKNCQIEFAGINGISAWVSNVASAECVFEGNTIANTGSAAIFSRGNNIIITDNVISYAGIVPGMAFKGNDCQGIWAQGSTNPANYTIERNRITYTGHNGIGVYFQSAGSTSYNYIAYAMQKTDDGGGIYYGGISAHERIIDHNLVLYTGIGNPNGNYITRGIYMDSGADGAIITHNTVAHTLNSGLNFHSGDNNEVHDNILYDNGYQFTYPPAGIQIYKDDDFPSTTGNNISRNQFIAKLATQYAFTEIGYSAGEAAALGTFDNNYYARPIDNDNVIYYQGAEHTLASWQTFSSQDAASSQGTQTVTDTSEFYFVYNDSIGARTYTLTEPKIDIEGKQYAYSISLQPFESAVLFCDPTGIWEPSGKGWEDVYSKRNFKDEVNFVEGLRINGVPVIVSNELSRLAGLTSTAGELNVLDGVDQTLKASEINTLKGIDSNVQDQIDALNVSGGDAKADTSLSNLSSVAINTHLLPGVDGAVNLGSATKQYGNIYLNGSISTASTIAASGLVSTGPLRVGTTDTGSNVDSVKVSGTTIGFYDGATQLSYDFPAADEGELGDYVPLLGDTLYSNNPAYYTQRQVDSLAATITGTSFAWIDSANYYTKEFNIIDYGAVSNDGNSDAAAIQAAINAAFATVTDVKWVYPEGYAGKVIIPSGIWYIDVADTLKSFIEIDISNGAVFTTPPAYTGSIFENIGAYPKDEIWNDAETRLGGLENIYVHGGTYKLPEAASFMKLTSHNVWQLVSFNKFADFVIDGGYYGIYLDADTCSAYHDGVWYTPENGWNNCNQFSNIIIDTAEYGVYIENGSGHIFDKIQFEVGYDTAIYINGGGGNIFSSGKMGDFIGDGCGIYIASGVSQNYFNINDANLSISDNGYDNIFITNGTISAGTSISTTSVAGPSGSGSEVVLRRKDTDGINNSVTNGSEIGELRFDGFHTSAYYEGAAIRAFVNGAPGVGDMPSSLGFYVSPDGASTATRRINIADDLIYFTNPPVPSVTDGSVSLGSTTRQWGQVNLYTGKGIYWNAGGAGQMGLLHAAGTPNTVTLSGGNLALGANELTQTAGGNYISAPLSTGTSVGTSITAAMLSRFIYFNETEAIDLSADPQIENGSEGQIITIVGISDTNTLTLDDGTGLVLSGQCILGVGDTITLAYLNGDWVELSRSDN